MLFVHFLQNIIEVNIYRHWVETFNDVISDSRMSLLSCLLCWCHSLAYDAIITTSDIMFLLQVNIKGRVGTSYALAFSLEKENISRKLQFMPLNA